MHCVFSSTCEVISSSVSPALHAFITGLWHVALLWMLCAMSRCGTWPTSEPASVQELSGRPYGFLCHGTFAVHASTANELNQSWRYALRAVVPWPLAQGGQVGACWCLDALVITGRGMAAAHIGVNKTRPCLCLAQD